MFMNILAFLCVLAAVPRTLAAPSLEERQSVPSIPFLYPTPGSVWVSGWFHNITWDTTQVTDILPLANVFLTKAGIADTTPLVGNLNLTQGRVEVQVPAVAPASDYGLRLTVGSVTAESGDFTIAPSKAAASTVSAAPPSTGTTVVVFPSTTITTVISSTTTSSETSPVPSISSGASSLTSAASSLTSVASSLSSVASSVSSVSASSVSASEASSASSALSSVSSSFSSVVASISSSASSALSSVTSSTTTVRSSPTIPHSSSSGSATSSSAARGLQPVENLKTKFAVAAALVVLSSLGAALVL